MTPRAGAAGPGEQRPERLPRRLRGAALANGSALERIDDHRGTIDSALAQRGHRVSGTVALLGKSGWPPERTIDAGDITGARATESYLVIWLRIMARTGGQSFNIAVQRAA